MSNHSGSFMLNQVLHLLREQHVFERLGHTQSQQLVLAMVKLAVGHYDCNAAEILESHSQHLGICSYCRSAADQLTGGICEHCRQELK